MKTSLVLLVCLLSGCASTREFASRHPVVTGIGVALVAGSIAASTHHGDGNNAATGGAIGSGQLPCTPQPNGACR
jgi:xanthine/uracil permease